MLFDRHYKDCKEAGIYVDVYHWTYATNLTEARAEAGRAIREISNYNIDYPIALDFVDKNVIAVGLTKAQYTAICKAYMYRIKAANYYPMLYCNLSTIDNPPNFADLSAYDLWLSQYTSEGYQRDFGQGMWQFSVAGHSTLDYGRIRTVTGVKGQCDCNWAHRLRRKNQGARHE